MAGARGDQMMVIALGRLGMREFDLGSDADLIFVIPGRRRPPLLDRRRRAHHPHVSSYTGEGVMFAIDTRLRPNGARGRPGADRSRRTRPTSQQHAEAWEGIAYMKSRAVAGNLERATAFLHELQEVDWRRYGQSMRSRQELAKCARGWRGSRARAIR